MARGRNKPSPALSGDEAIAALKWLVARGTVRVTQVARALAERELLVNDIRRRLAALGAEGIQLIQQIGSPTAANPRKVGRRKTPMTAARKAQLKAHGQYLGAIRRLSAANRAKVKAIRGKKGVPAAIAAARKLAKT